jgi:transposase-like protein
MKRSRFVEQRIIGILKVRETGVSVAELCRKHGMSAPLCTSGRPSTAASESKIP